MPMLAASFAATFPTPTWAEESLAVTLGPRHSPVTKPMRRWPLIPIKARSVPSYWVA